MGFQHAGKQMCDLLRISGESSLHAKRCTSYVRLLTVVIELIVDRIVGHSVVEDAFAESEPFAEVPVQKNKVGTHEQEAASELLPSI